MIESQLARWIKALRSGDFRQGQNWLRSNGSYCCLGVLAKVTNDSLPPGACRQDLDEQQLDQDFLPSAGLLTQVGYLPDVLLDACDDDCPTPRTSHDGVSLASLNDGMWVTAYELGYMRAKSRVLSAIPASEIKFAATQAAGHGRYLVKLNFQQIADLIEEFGEVL